MKKPDSLPKATRKGFVQVLENFMISILLFLFTFYAFTTVLAFLGYILWCILCTNSTLSFIITHQKQELLTLHIESTDPTIGSEADTNQPLTLSTIPGTLHFSPLSRIGIPFLMKHLQ